MHHHLKSGLAHRWITALAAASVLSVAPAVQAQSDAPIRLRIVGGLAGVNQFTRHEEPFWTQELGKLSGGRVSAEIVPFDRAGIRGQEMLRLMQLGVVPFGTALLSLSAGQDPELSAADLAGLNPDMKSLRRTVAAFRPYLEKTLRDRYGIEVLALYTYPAQVTFCAAPMASLADLAGRRVRTSSPAQSDLVESLGGTPVQTSFAEIMQNMRGGNIECAMTGTMSGNTIGLHEITTHVHSMGINWGLSVFGANAAAFNALPSDVQALLRRELPKLEQQVWAESERETSDGIACNVGAANCVAGRKGRMTEVKVSTADERRRREIFAGTVLPRWVQRCGPQCADVWNQTIGPAVGFAARAR
ncbi:MAG: TRAP transporter substrate-binding protein [Betaproteobacteria bacterium]|jgi:TRAP-type C4-dicarboxylate transport system substrate-binding protein|nr:MAG: TRAP transporter substrate-binding protein [Betaproteobacteria bacterium]TMH33984.1 MAG: TRAP transporter substrate-binding protein [Betaproteobacteria bacterium]